MRLSMGSSPGWTGFCGVGDEGAGAGGFWLEAGVCARRAAPIEAAKRRPRRELESRFG